MIDGNEQILFDYCDISVAVSGPKGLMVPVVRNAEGMSFVDVENEINDWPFAQETARLRLMK